MLKRAWLVLSIAWFLFGMYAGSTAENGIRDIDVKLAIAPLIAGPVIYYLGRFIVTGRLR